MIHGDFGTSYQYRTPISGMISARLWVSLPLALYALVISVLIAFPVGIYAATKRGKKGDLIVMGATQFGLAIPNFWFAMMLVLIFCNQFTLVFCWRIYQLGQRSFFCSKIFDFASTCTCIASSRYSGSCNALCPIRCLKRRFYQNCPCKRTFPPSNAPISWST